MSDIENPNFERPSEIVSRLLDTDEFAGQRDKWIRTYMAEEDEGAGRKVRPVDGGLAKVGFEMRSDNGERRVEIGEAQYKEQNEQSVPESELSELMEALGYVYVDGSGEWSQDHSKKFLESEQMGDAVVLAELGDMMNILLYTKIALDNTGEDDEQKMVWQGETPRGEQVTEGKQKVDAALSAMMNLDQVMMNVGGKDKSLLSLLPESVQALYMSTEGDPEQRMRLMMTLAETKQQASASEENPRAKDKGKLRAVPGEAGFGAKVCIVLGEQELMGQNLLEVMGKRGLSGDVENGLNGIVKSSQRKRRELVDELDLGSMELDSSEEPILSLEDNQWAMAVKTLGDLLGGSSLSTVG